MGSNGEVPIAFGVSPTKLSKETQAVLEQAMKALSYRKAPAAQPTAAQPLSTPSSLSGSSGGTPSSLSSAQPSAPQSSTPQPAPTQPFSPGSVTAKVLRNTEPQALGPSGVAGLSFKDFPVFKPLEEVSVSTKTAAVEGLRSAASNPSSTQTPRSARNGGLYDAVSVSLSNSLSGREDLDLGNIMMGSRIDVSSGKNDAGAEAEGLGGYGSGVEGLGAYGSYAPSSLHSSRSASPSAHRLREHHALHHQPLSPYTRLDSLFTPLGGSLGGMSEPGSIRSSFIDSDRGTLIPQTMEGQQTSAAQPQAQLPQPQSVVSAAPQPPAQLVSPAAHPVATVVHIQTPVESGGRAAYQSPARPSTSQSLDSSAQQTLSSHTSRLLSKAPQSLSPPARQPHAPSTPQLANPGAPPDSAALKTMDAVLGPSYGNPRATPILGQRQEISQEYLHSHILRTSMPALPNQFYSSVASQPAVMAGPNPSSLALREPQVMCLLGPNGATANIEWFPVPLGDAVYELQIMLLSMADDWKTAYMGPDTKCSIPGLKMATSFGVRVKATGGSTSGISPTKHFATPSLASKTSGHSALQPPTPSLPQVLADVSMYIPQPAPVVKLEASAPPPVQSTASEETEQPTSKEADDEIDTDVPPQAPEPAVVESVSDVESFLAARAFNPGRLETHITVPPRINKHTPSARSLQFGASSVRYTTAQPLSSPSKVASDVANPAVLMAHVSPMKGSTLAGITGIWPPPRPQASGSGVSSFSYC